MSRRMRHCNITATYYDGVFDVTFDCVGSGKPGDNCATAQDCCGCYYTCPPEKEDVCQFRGDGCVCLLALSKRRALVALAEKIEREIKGMEKEGQDNE